MNEDPLTGKLVRLVAINLEEDVRLITEWERDSEFQRLLNSEHARRYNPKQVKESFEKGLDSMHFYMIQRLEDNKNIGLIALDGFNWVTGNAWVGIGIGVRELWGKGCGSDAMRILLRHAFTVLNLNRITLNVFEINQRGYASYRKCGFQEEGRLPGALMKAGQRYDLIFMGILREDWQASQNQEGQQV
ncbi:MAG: GNAT family protein [Chloroflexota bacterium]|jgi:RimJ/RimL family protein N-acetyltransferase